MRFPPGCLGESRGLLPSVGRWVAATRTQRMGFSPGRATPAQETLLTVLVGR